MKELEALLVQYCSPTLAGIKTGSLFNYTTKQNDDLKLQIKKWNRILISRGVTMIILKRDQNRNLIYVCRPKKLERDFADADVRAFLSFIGYDCSNMGLCLQRLIKRIGRSVSFPHEIGLFLGYPLPDVKGFIENAGQNCKCCGMWKVYCNECQAVKLFEKFNQCTRIYCRCLQYGLSITRLTVAA